MHLQVLLLTQKNTMAHLGVQEERYQQEKLMYLLVDLKQQILFLELHLVKQQHQLIMMEQRGQQHHQWVHQEEMAHLQKQEVKQQHLLQDPLIE